MPTLTASAIIPGFLFGSIGFVAFVYGKRMHAWKPMFLGLGLMAYTYFVSDALIVYGIGAVLTAALFFFRD